MLRKICSIILTTIAFSSIALGYSGGSGTEGSPYLLSSAADIELLGGTPADWGKYFEVTQNIDLTGYSNIRIGTSSSSPFSGYFDGSGKIISNYTFNNSVDYGALFGYINAAAVIEGVQMTGVNVNAGSGKYVAALVGNNYGIVERCTAQGTVSGGNFTGGLVARNYGTIENCSSSVNVTSQSRGGCLTSYNIGGGSINKCRVDGSVTGLDRVGGIVGENIGNISNCYSGASVSGTEKVGGIAGSTATGSITNCYAYGTVTGTLYKGAVIGDRVSGAASGCFFDNETTAPLLGVGRGASTGVTGKTTAQMQTESTFTDAGWDFVSTWWLAPGAYPSLEWEQKTKVISLEGNLNFGGLDVGGAAQSTLTIYNDGNSELTVTEISYPAGFSGAWNGIIEAGQSQVVTVTFAPTSAQTYGGTITVSSDKTDGENTIECAGIGIGGIIRLTGDISFGNVVVSSSAVKMLTINNDGTGALAVSGIVYPAGFSGSWSGSIPAGSFENVVVTFSPVAAQSYGGDLTVNSDKVSGTSTMACSGTGIAQSRVIALSGDLAFGDVEINTTSQKIITIQNTGNSALTVTGISYPQGFSGNWSGVVAANGGTQQVTVTFSPTDARGYGGTVTVASNATAGDNTMAASGQGIGAIIRVSTPLDFGNAVVGDTVQRTLTIYNDGNRTLNVSGITYPNAVFTGAWSGTVTAGASKAVTVTFAPIAANNYDGTITVASDAKSGSGQAAVTATAGPETRIIGLSGNMSFGDVVVGTTSQRTLTISNSGNRPLTVSAINYPVGFSGIWSGTIAAGASQPITVTFAPAVVQSYGGSIDVVSNKTSGTNTMSIAGVGIAVTRVICVEGNLIFDDTVNGQTSQRTLTISNSGNSPLTVTDISYPDMFSGQWSGTIAAGGSQAVTVTFAPTAQGNYGGPITVNSDATSGTGVALSWGVGIDRAIRLSGDMAFGSVDVNTTAIRTLTIHNDGNRALTVSGISYPAGFSGSFSGSIAAGGSQAVTVTFAPMIAQNYSGTITVASDKTTGNNSIACSGIGNGGVVALSGDMSFGDVTVGIAANSMLTISNTGTGTMTVSAIDYPAGFSGSWSTGVIAAGGVQNVLITFSPMAAQSYSGTITVHSNATGGTGTLACSGEGITRVIVITGNTTFGDVDINETSQKTFTITNTGNRPLTVTDIIYPSGFSGDWSGGQIAAGGQKVVTLTFAPTTASLYIGNIAVLSDATNDDNTIFVSGEGVSRVISLTGDLSFGDVDVNGSTQLTFTIQNTGSRALNVTSVSYPAGFSGPWSGTITAGGSQAVTVTFAPTAAQTYSGAITVNADTTSGTNTIDCSGVGIGGVIRLSGALGFGSVNVDTTSQLDFTIHNDGTGPLAVSGINYPVGFSGLWSGTVAAGGSQAITVTFAPTAAQSYGGDVAVASDSVSGTNTIACSGIGSGGIIRLVGSMAFGDTVINQTTSKTLTIYNDGTGPLVVSGISSSDPAFSGVWSGTIAVGASQAVTITFAPTVTGSYGGDITVSSDATSGVNTIACAGAGISRGISLSLSVAALGDVDINTSAQTTLTIENTGNRALAISGISYPSGFSDNWSSGTIAAGATKDVMVVFAPTAAQSYGGTITVASDKTEGTNTASISGYGVTRIVSVSGNLSFGLASVGQMPTLTMTIENTGIRALAVSDISYPAGFSGSFSGSIAAGGSQVVTVTFAPTEAKTYSGTITVNSDATSGEAAIDCFGFVLAGDGTAGNPYQLSTDYHLEAVNDDLTACYILMNNISLSGTIYTGAVIAADQIVTTIEFEGTPFSGTFDGNGYAITDLTIDTDSTICHYLGLFGKIVAGANIVDTGVTGLNIATGDDSRSVGGLCGYNSGGLILNSYTTGAITGEAVTLSIGGLCGYNSGSIEASCSAVDVTSGRNSLDTGGLCGTNQGSIADSYASGTVIGQSYVGGLCGYNYYGIISTSYARGSVTGKDFFGGLCGHDYDAVTDSFWDMQTSGLSVSAGGIGKTTAEMMDMATFINAGWDFAGETVNGTDDVWSIRSGDFYPNLSWQTYATADLNSDMLVNVADLVILGADWLEEGIGLTGDINNDGNVNLLDFVILAAQWVNGAE